MRRQNENPPHPVLDACVGSRCPRAWREFVDRFEDALDAGVLGVLRRFGVAARRELVDDLRQEVYCRLLERDARALRACRGDEDGAVAAYLRTVAANVTVDALRASGAAKRGLAVTRSGDGRRTTVADRVAGRAPSAERRLLVEAARRSFFDRCRDLLGGGLARRDAVMLYLAVFESWTSRELAGRFGLSSQAVDSRLCRLRRGLESRGFRVPRRRGRRPTARAG